MNIESMNALSEILKVILQMANVVVLAYALYKFINKPHDTLESRVDALEEEVDSLKKKEMQREGVEKEQKKTNATFKSVMLSFVNFEIAYCLHTEYPHTEELMDAKKELEQYLTGNTYESRRSE